MTIYEITAHVSEPGLFADFERFMLDEHIPAVVAAGDFVSAVFARSEPGRYRIAYRAESREKLDRYLKHRAPALRELTMAAFPAGVEFAREEWEVIGDVDRQKAKNEVKEMQ